MKVVEVEKEGERGDKKRSKKEWRNEGGAAGEEEE